MPTGRPTRKRSYAGGSKPIVRESGRVINAAGPGRAAGGRDDVALDEAGPDHLPQKQETIGRRPVPLGGPDCQAGCAGRRDPGDGTPTASWLAQIAQRVNRPDTDGILPPHNRGPMDDGWDRYGQGGTASSGAGGISAKSTTNQSSPPPRRATSSQVSPSENASPTA